jgi:hypothetical protein
MPDGHPVADIEVHKLPRPEIVARDALDLIGL